jgi:GH25 family lysozyme M1 (1,4-beta-N-acetylmuramidase)
MIEGFDCSHWQKPQLLNWATMAERNMFLIARATYGAKTADRSFGEFARLAREHGIPFGAYLFYRQTQTVESQLALFDEQLKAIGGLQEGDFFPVLDMEGNEANGDGTVNPKLFNRACDEIGDAWKRRYGGCILYMSAYFPSHLGPQSQWEWTREVGYYYWIAQYGVAPGECSERYLPWHIHQHIGDAGPHSPLYNGGKTAIDQNVAPDIERLLIAGTTPTVSDPHRTVRDEIPWVVGLDDETREGLEDARKADNLKMSEGT